MESPFFILQPDLFTGSSLDAMRTSLDALAFGHAVVDPEDYGKGHAAVEMAIDRIAGEVHVATGGNPGGRPVLAMVSVQVAARLSNIPAEPLLFWHPSTYRQSLYTARYGAWMLNSDQVFVPWREFARRRDQWRRMFGNRVFVRSDSGQKTLAGQVFPTNDADEWTHLIRASDKTTGVMDDTLVGVSSAKPIDGFSRFKEVEWRCWVADGQVFAWSPYAWEGTPSREDAPLPDDCRYVAEAATRRMDNMDDVMVIDVCRSNGKAAIVEINAASTSGVYDVDPHALASRMGIVATRRWKDLFG
jgi:hypothetical protein